MLKHDGILIKQEKITHVVKCAERSGEGKRVLRQPKCTKANPSGHLGCDLISERHRHRYEVNPIYKDEFKKQGLEFSGHCKANKELPEVVEKINVMLCKFMR